MRSLALIAGWLRMALSMATEVEGAVVAETASLSHLHAL